MKKATILNILALLSSVLLLNGESHADEIYVDSVPSGANVYAVEAGDLKGSVDFDNPVGITPLTLQASEYPEKSFLVLMDADKYVEKVKAIPEMAEWIADLSDNYFGESDLDRHNFIFGTSQVVKLNSKDRKKMLAIGPIIDLQWPTQKRICVPFIPNTVRYASFYPLMPQRGTFKRCRPWSAKRGPGVRGRRRRVRVTAVAKGLKVPVAGGGHMQSAIRYAV